MKFLENRSDMIYGGGSSNDTGVWTLDQLEFMKTLERGTIEDRIAIMECKEWTRIAALWGVSDRWRQLIFHRRKYADQVTLLMDDVLSRMTPRLLTWGDGWTLELSVIGEKQCRSAKVDLVPTRRTLVLSLLSLRKLYEIQDLIKIFDINGRWSLYADIIWNGVEGCSQIKKNENS